MRRRDFLERTLEGMVLLYSGLLLNTDEKRIDRAANEIVFQSEESNYVNIRRKLTDSGIEIIEDYRELCINHQIVKVI